MTEWYVNLGNNKVQGPFSSAQLKQFAAAHKIKPQTSVRPGKDGEWVEAKHVKGLFEAREVTAPAPPAAQRVVFAVVEPPPAQMEQVQSLPAIQVDPVTHVPGRRANTKCRDCGQRVSGWAESCPHCGAPQPAMSKSLMGVYYVLAGLVVFGLVFYFFGGGLWWHAARNMNQIQQQVATDAVRQYEIAKRNGSAIDAYVQAGFVAAAFLQAKDEKNYQQWKAIQAAEGERAGMPSF